MYHRADSFPLPIIISLGLLVGIVVVLICQILIIAPQDHKNAMNISTNVVHIVPYNKYGGPEIDLENKINGALYKAHIYLPQAKVGDTVIINKNPYSTEIEKLTYRDHGIVYSECLSEC